MAVSKRIRSIPLIKVLSVLVFTITLYGQERGSAYPFFIVQMSDPQFGFIENNKGFSRESELYGKAVDAVNRIRPDFVVITGDFVHNRHDEAQWNEFDRITGRIDSDIPVWLSPGNHDIGQEPGKEDIEQFAGKYGYDRFSFRHKRCLFIGLNTCIIKSGNKEHESIQYDWLQKKLKRSSRARHIILFGHYPFFIKDPEEKEIYSNIGTELREKYLELFRKYNVDAVFSGHLHNNADSAIGGTAMVVTSAVGKQLGDAQAGLRVIKIFRDRIEHDYYSLEEIPEKVTF